MHVVGLGGDNGQQSGKGKKRPLGAGALTMKCCIAGLDLAGDIFYMSLPISSLLSFPVQFLLTIPDKRHKMLKIGK